MLLNLWMQSHTEGSPCWNFPCTRINLFTFKIKRNLPLRIDPSLHFKAHMQLSGNLVIKIYLWYRPFSPIPCWSEPLLSLSWATELLTGLPVLYLLECVLQTTIWKPLLKCKPDCVISLLKSFQWLPISPRTKFISLTSETKTLYDMAPGFSPSWVFSLLFPLPIHPASVTLMA